MKNTYTRDFSDWILVDVPTSDIFPFAREPRSPIVYSSPYSITQEGYEPNTGSYGITLRCLRSKASVTLLAPFEWEQQQHIEPHLVIRRIAVMIFTELGDEGHQVRELIPELCALAEEQELTFDSQNVESESQPLDDYYNYDVTEASDISGTVVAKSPLEAIPYKKLRFSGSTKDGMSP